MKSKKKTAKVSHVRLEYKSSGTEQGIEAKLNRAFDVLFEEVMQKRLEKIKKQLQ